MSEFDKMTLAELRMAIAVVQGWQNIRTVDGPTPEGLIIAETPDFKGRYVQKVDTVTLPDWPNSDSDCATLVNDIVGTDRSSIQTGLKWVGEKYRPGYYEAWALISWKNATIPVSSQYSFFACPQVV